jgi:hypothetical protein
VNETKHLEDSHLRLVRRGLSLVLVGMVGWVVARLARNPGQLLRVTPRGLTVQDFASHRAYARAFWEGSVDYSVESHLQMMERWSGTCVSRALPFGYSPTMFFLLGPSALMPLVPGYVLWSMLGLLAALWVTRAEDRLSVLGLLVFLSPTGIGGFALGQTAAIAAAGLTFLAFNTGGSAGSPWSSAVILWALTAKPPLAATAGTALLALGRYRSVGYALLFTVLSTMLASFKLGPGWMGHYWDMITRYDTTTADPVFAWSLRPDTMGNLRAMTTAAGAGDRWSCLVSAALWLIGLVGVAIAGRSGRVSQSTLVALAVLAYLLLFPHVSFTEDVQLVVVLSLLATASNTSASLTWIAAAMVLVDVLLIPGAALGAGLTGTSVAFSAKLGLAALVTAHTFRALGEPDGRS